MTHRIFVSYASCDFENEQDLKWFDTFCKNLVNEIAITEGWAKENLVFRAKSSIQAGQTWTVELEHALRTAQVMLCFYSTQYFLSEWCGREFAVFTQRHEQWLKSLPAGAQAGTTRVIPVIWVPRTNAPACATLLQDRDDAYPPDYHKLGLRRLFELRRKREYTEAKTALAERIIGALKQPAMPHAAALGDMQSIKDAFAEQRTAGAAPQGSQRSLRKAYFVFAAANRDELHGAKQELDAWGSHNGWDWQPYHPTNLEPVGALAQLAAGNKKLPYQQLPCDPDLPRHLKDAKKANSPVVIFTDPWTATLPTYRAVLEEYDLLNLTNCALLVPWNEADAETARSKAELEQNLWAACEQKYRYNYPCHYWQIRTSEELRDRALTVLDEITLRMLDQAGPSEVRKAQSAELTNAAAVEGIRTEIPSQLVNVTPPPAESTT